MKYAEFFAFSFIFLLLAGCAQNQNEAMSADINDMFAPSDVTCDPPGPNPCMCYTCEQHPSIFSFTEIRSSLLGGECSFEACDNDDYSTLLEDYHASPYAQLLFPAPKIPRFFSFGMGPDFHSFDEANKYCGYSMDLPVQWLSFNSMSPDEPPIPSPLRSACFLDRTIIPLYILYNTLRSISPPKTQTIASSLDNQFAPIYVTTQPNYFMYDSDSPLYVRTQIETIKDACPNCLTVLMLPHEDENMNPEHIQNTWKKVLEEVIGAPSQVAAQKLDPNSIYNKIDFIGMGLIITPESSANHDCKPEFRIYEAANFTYSTILKQYQKPSIWAYFGVEEGSADGCTIDGGDVARSYDYLFQNAQMLAYSGIVGVAHIGFSDDKMPSIVPPGSQFGLVSSTTPLTQNHPQLNAWSDDCHYYYSLYDRIASVYSPKGRATHCAFTFNYGMKRGIVHDEGTMDNEVPIDTENAYSCGAQISSEPPPLRYYKGVPLPQLSASDCTNYPELNVYAGVYSQDPLFVRAISYVETGEQGLVEPDARNYVLCEEKMGQPLDGSGCWRSAINADNPPPPASLCPQSDDSGLECGLMGRMESYQDGDGECVPIDRKYNPFNATNACLGSRELRDYFEDADLQAAITSTSNAQILGLKDANGNPIPLEEEWMHAYLVAYAYDMGGISFALTAISNFAGQYNLPENGDCEGNQKFTVYVSKCAGTAYSPNAKDGNLYPSKVIAAYVSLLDECQ